MARVLPCPECGQHTATYSVEKEKAICKNHACDWEVDAPLTDMQKEQLRLQRETGG